MHNHGNNNGNGGHDSKMMWMMMAMCLLPIIFVAFTGGAGRVSIWWLLGAGAVMLGIHAFAMRGHGGHGPQPNDSTGGGNSHPANTLPSGQTNVHDHQTAGGKDKHGCC